jgi:hypothetical protein
MSADTVEPCGDLAAWTPELETYHAKLDDEFTNVVATLSAYAARCPGRVREVLTTKPRTCALCRAEFPAGTVFWTSTRPFKGGRRWWTDYVCPLCPEPYPPAVKVSAERLHRWTVAHAKRGRGRPAVTLTGSERALVVELRASGLGELRLAREFRARTGRKVAARTLARFTRA